MGWLDVFRRRPAAEAKPGQSRSADRKPRPIGTKAARNFQAGQFDRITGSWTSQNWTPDNLILRQWRTLVARSREQAQTNDYARKFRQLVRVNVIGSTGIKLQAKIKDPNGQIDTLASQAIEDGWEEWGRKGNCEVTGKLTWLQVQNLLIDSACTDGELLAVIHEGEGPMGFQLQLIDPLRLDPQMIENTDSGNFIRFGIEFTPLGKPVAYYFLSLDANREDHYTWGNKQYVRVPAENVIHEFLPEMVGQKRGIPWMATPLLRLKMLGGYEDAALVAARVGAAKMGIIRPQADADPPDDDPEILTDAEPGTFWVAPPGYEVDKFDLEYPKGEFATFHKACLRGISAGLGVAYNNLANDLEGVNFSSIRQGTLDERETYKALQAWLSAILHERVYERWLMIQLLRQSITVMGKPLKLERFEKYRSVNWQARRWQWIDPASDMAAAITGINNRIQSRGQVIMDQGRDPQEVEQELRQEEADADARAIKRVQDLQAACEAANKKNPGLNLHWSQVVSIGGAMTAPGAFLQAVGQNVNMAEQIKTQADAPTK